MCGHSRGACVLRTERLRDKATTVAGRASSTFFAVIGTAALAVAVVAAMPAEAKKRQNSAKPIEDPIPDIANGDPMTLVVSLSNQKVDIYRGTTLITSSKVSTGMRGSNAGMSRVRYVRRKSRRQSRLEASLRAKKLCGKPPRSQSELGLAEPISVTSSGVSSRYAIRPARLSDD